MGQSHSGPYPDLIRARNSQEWKAVGHLQDCQLWQHCATLEKYMAYPLNWEDADSHYNLEIYHFRKLNRQYLVAPQFILKNSQDMCGQQGSLHLLLQHIPARLGEINRLLSFEDRLHILASTYSALHTLNYVYGPLLISENQICFDEAGRVKVWVNQVLCFNEPSEPKSIFEEEGTPSSAFMLHCVTEVLRTVGNRQIFTYPQDFRELILKATTFAEGQQLVNDYCILKGIVLASTIPFWNYQQRPKEFLFHSSSKKDTLSCSLLAIDHQSRPQSLFSDSSVLPSLKDQNFVTSHPMPASFVRPQSNPPAKIIINVGKKEICRNGGLAFFEQKDFKRRSQQAESVTKKTQTELRINVRENPRVKIVFNLAGDKKLPIENKNHQAHSGKTQLFEKGVTKKIDPEKFVISKHMKEAPEQKLNIQSKTKGLQSLAQNVESHEQKIQTQQQNFVEEVVRSTELKDKEEYHETKKELFQEAEKQNEIYLQEKEQISSLGNRNELKVDKGNQGRIEEEKQAKQISLKQLFSNFRRQTEKNIPTLQQIEVSQQTSYQTIKNTTFGKIQIEPELAYQQYIHSLDNEHSFQKSIAKTQQRKCKREEKLEERYNKYVKGRQLKANTHNKSTGVATLPRNHSKESPFLYLQEQSSSLWKRDPEQSFQKLKSQSPSYQKLQGFLFS